MSKSLGKYDEVSGRKSMPGGKYGMNLGGSGSSFCLEKQTFVIFISFYGQEIFTANLT